MSEQQKPSVGRIVHYYLDEPNRSPHKPFYPAVITHVWDDQRVNLHVFDDGTNRLGGTDLPTSVVYGVTREGDPEPPPTQFWTWPPRV